MARKKISEFKVKQLLIEAFEYPMQSITVDAAHPLLPEVLNLEKTYVVKVDEGIKKRMKQGLVFLKQSPKDIPHAIAKLQKKGFTHFIIEPFIPHSADEEKYLSLSRTREGITILYSSKGGIDIEENQHAIKKIIASSEKDLQKVAKELLLPPHSLDEIFAFFDKYHFTLLEINPLVVTKEGIYLLDVAGEVDSTGEFFVDEMWSNNDFREPAVKQKSPEELAIEELSQKSQASFKMDVLNQDGSLFMLLSGGGASIVVADEVYNLGHGKKLANYGEYSGNPNAEEVYLFTKNVLHLLLKSKAKKKVLIIAGGVANFTDIRRTFAGVIQALDEQKSTLQKQHIKVFVRRGGPHQREGLANMKEFLQKTDLYGAVSGPEMPLQEIVTLALKEL